jgi:ADP-ribose pyrophosphatase YjhB (NUDIX family)
MRHRIRAAALIVENNHILLVQHVHPHTGYTWWVPPGGGVEEVDDSLFDCVRRETFEETGLAVELGRIVYIREFVDTENDTYHLELFLSSTNHSGELTIENIQGTGPDEHFIKDVRWIPQDSVPHLTVFPEVLKAKFWQDLRLGFPETRYLGRSNG